MDAFESEGERERFNTNHLHPRATVDHIPLKKSSMEATLKIKHAFVGRGMAIARKYGQVKNEQYDSCTYAQAEAVCGSITQDGLLKRTYR